MEFSPEPGEEDLTPYNKPRLETIESFDETNSLEDTNSLGHRDSISQRDSFEQRDASSFITNSYPTIDSGSSNSDIDDN